ncbi:MAG: RHS repeat-associated core domain-containing protein [Planctomycetota bacterium]
MTTTNYVWDPLNDSYLMETDETGETTAVYTQEPSQYGGIISQRRDSTEAFYFHDALGSTRYLADSSGSITDIYSYDGLGNPVSKSGNFVNPFYWVGRSGYYWDTELSSHYIRARTFQPDIARWLSIDPIYASNLYAYSNNSPTVEIDPSGLLPTPGELRAWNNRLTEAEKPHKKYIYYRLSKMGEMFNKLRAATSTIVGFVWDPLGGNFYLPTTNTMFTTEPVAPNTVIHESVHVLDDKEGWYLPAYSLTGRTRAEALGYTTEYLVSATNTGIGFKHLEDMIEITRFMNSGRTPEGQVFPPGLGIEESFPDKLTCAKAKELWRSAWNGMAAVLNEKIWVRGAIVRSILNADINDVRSKLGLDFRCSQGLGPLEQMGAGWSWEYEGALRSAGIFADNSGGCNSSRSPCRLTCPNDLPESLK